MRFKTEFASVSKGGLSFEADADGIIDIPDLHVYEFADSIGGILQPAPDVVDEVKPDAPAKKHRK